MPKPKVCFVGLENLPVVSPDYNQHGIGGEQVQHTLLARALTKRGYQVSMIVADYGQPEGLVVDGIKLFRAHGLTEGLPGLRFIHPRLTGLLAAMKRADSDVYYVSCASVHVGIAAWFAKRAGKRVVFRIAHDTDCDPKNLLIKYTRDKKIYEYGLRRVDAILAQSEQQARALVANYGLKSTVASMLVEPNQRKLSFEERDVDVLWVNNIRGFKRADLALELAKRLPHLRIHMIGGPMSGSEDLYEKIRSQAGEISNLTFHGRVPYHEVNEFYERAKVFVNTSDSEGFPNSYLQAWRRGVPTVVFFDPDEIVTKNGLGAAALSMDQMVDVVSSLSSSREEWWQSSLRCHNFMDLHFADDIVLRPYVEALEGP